MIKIAIISLKGGVGKTTVSVNLGDALSRMGKRVLLADLDPQNDLTQNLGLDPALHKGIEYFITDDIPFKSIVKEYSENLHFLPSGKKLKELEISLSKLYKRNQKLNILLKYAFTKQQLNYDYVILDCCNNPNLLNYNALSYVHHVFVPVQCQYLGLRGSQRTLFFVHKMQALFNQSLKISGIIPSMYDARNNLSETVLEEMKKTFEDLVLSSKIRVNVSLAEAPGSGKTIFDYKPKSRGAEDFKNLANEFVMMFEETY